MKKLSLYLLLAASLPASSCGRAGKSPSPDVGQAAIAFADSMHRFHEITLQQPVDSFDFVFTNTGNGPLVILGVETSCHCIRASYEQKPVPAGGKSYVRVVYDGSGRGPEYFHKSVRVVSNAVNTSVKELVITGELGKP